MQPIVLSAPRSGSTLSARSLNQIPGTCCHGEPLLPAHVRGYRDGSEPLFASRE